MFTCDPNTPYHLVARTNEKAPFACGMSTVWEIFSDQLYFAHHAYRVQVLCFVLMRNHFHLIAKFPEGNLSDSMRSFMGTTSRVIAHEARTINHVYGGRVFRSRLGSFHYFMNAYKYVYQNPVRAGLVHRPDEYEFSTLPGLIGRSRLSIPIEEDTIFFGDQLGTLKWLNTRPSEENLIAIRKALRREEFKLPRSKSTLRAHELETFLL